MSDNNTDATTRPLDCLTRVVFWLIIVFSVVSCSTPGRLEPLSSVIIPGSESGCADPFVSRNWQFIHSIEAVLAGGGTASVIGVTNVFPERKVAHCVIMTVEGFVLFDALYDQTVHVKRGIPPFESKAFAEGLMKDISLVFFRPSGELTGSALSEDGALTCRYKTGKETVEDVRVHPNHTWDIHQYVDKRLDRSVTAGSGKIEGKNGVFIPKQLELTAYGRHGYSLHLRLIEATRLANLRRNCKGKIFEI